MIKKTLNVQISDDVPRPIAMFVQNAGQFDSKIYVESDSMRLNAKSIMGMMTLGMENGMEITISAEGNDEEAAMKTLEEYLSGGR